MTDSMLLNIYKTIKSQGLQAFVDIEGYPNPSIITGNYFEQILLLLKVVLYYYNLLLASIIVK